MTVETRAEFVSARARRRDGGKIDQPAEKGVESWRSELESLFHDGVL